ncbi:MAG: winged helix-turn-helix transcriptional regulator [Cyanothece sp. SIO1E1]|nr:winged helix-turn-helix transcriptional regulator [Cyanothece sp. SIO1E1]
MIKSEELKDNFSQMASLIGDKARAKMLWSLLDGRAYTATELANAADITKQACSHHLAKLVSANLLQSVKQGRHKYYRYASDEVAQVIESLAYLLPHPPMDSSTCSHQKLGLQYARSCYDHLAGELGVNITQALVQQNILLPFPEHYQLGENAHSFFSSLDIDIQTTQKTNRKFAYPCLDWSERKPHLAGALGAALLDRVLARDWLRRKQDSRALILTGAGARGFEAWLKGKI